MSSLYTVTQMGSWCRKQIRNVSALTDCAMRLGGDLFGQAFTKPDLIAQNVRAGEVYQALEQETLKATEFVVAFDDGKLDINRVTSFETTAGCREGGQSCMLSCTGRLSTPCRPEYKVTAPADGAGAGAGAGGVT